MAFYTIDFTVTAAGVSPDTPQFAGHMGDHRAAVVRFSVPFEGYRYRLELTDGSGAYDVTGLLDADGGTVSYEVPSAWTAAGVAALRLVAVEQAEDGSETVRFHAAPAYLRFEDREEGEPLGQTARPAWQETLDEAQFLLTTVEQKLENGELNGKDGESGVYVGSGDMPDGYTVQIDPDGTSVELVDYIVEQGVEGIWTYRKWASGIGECWCRCKSTSVSKYNQEYCVFTAGLPFEFATTHPVCNCSGMQYSTYQSYLTLAHASTNMVEAYMWCETTPSDEYPCWFSFSIKGRWK